MVVNLCCLNPTSKFFPVLNCDRNSNLYQNQTHGFKEKKKEDSGDACHEVLLIFEIIDIISRIASPSSVK